MRVSISTITLTSGQAIQPSANVTVIVGPNNAGKSAIIGNVTQELAFEPHQQVDPKGRPVASITASMPSREDLVASLSARAEIRPPGVHKDGEFREVSFVLTNGSVLRQSAIDSAAGRPNRLGAIAGVITTSLGPENRGSVLASQGLPDFTMPQTKTPIQLLYSDRQLESKLSGFMTRAFGKPLLVNRHAGSQVHLQVGTVDIAEPRVGDQSPYLDAVMSLPMLSAQGAGMQAFMGTILTIVSNSYDIVLLDEPETFLHPPQARLLGEIVADLSRENSMQVIVATHSDDFLQGIISASKDVGGVSVVRLTRPTDTENRVAQVSPDAIESLYRDPLLRFSNIMDGIFYKGVVLCEAESDCTFYSAVLNHLEESESRPSSDLLFSQCGGKDRFGRAHQALASAAVPTAVIADIDILGEKEKFKSLFETMGGNFSAIEASYNVLHSSVVAQVVAPERVKTRQKLLELMDATGTAQLSRGEAEAVRDLVRFESGWKQVKRKGEGAIDSGNPLEAFGSLVAASRSLGLFILPVGELERFHPLISGNKQQWLRKVLETKAYEDSPKASDLLRDLLAFIQGQQ